MPIGLAMPPIADPSGYAFSIRSAAIAWSSKKQSTVALSSTKAEYRGAAVATCEAIWLKRLPKDLHEEVSDPMEIYCDNLSSIQLAKNLVFHARTKHIEVHYHFVQERVLSGDIELTYVPTNRQIADIFTKPLGLDKLRQFSGALGLCHLDVPNLRGRVEPELEPEPELELEPEPEVELEPEPELQLELEADRSEGAESESRVDSETVNQTGCPAPGRSWKGATTRADQKDAWADQKDAWKAPWSRQQQSCEGQAVNRRVNWYRPESRCWPTGRC
jgi:hypothetical protein